MKMYQRNYSILFCVLLASTFVHELKARSSSQQISQNSTRIVQRTSVTLQVRNQILIISHFSSKSVLLVEAKSSRFVLLNGRSGSCIGVDRESNKGSYISSGVWISSSQSIEEYVSSLQNGLTELLVADSVSQFELTSVSEEILTESARVVVNLASDINEAVTVDLTLSLNLVITVVDQIRVLFRGVLLGFLERIEDRVIPLPGDICSLVNTLQGIASVIQRACGSYSQAIERGIQLEIEAILRAAHGLEALSKLLKQLGNKVTLESLIDDLGDIEGLFRLISQLGGNSNRGISGSFKVAREIVSYTKGKESLNDVINCLIQYLAHSKQGNSRNQSAELKKTLRELSSVIQLLNTSGKLNKTAKIVRDLINDKLTVKGINISRVIDLLLQAADEQTKSNLEILVEVLLLFVPAVDLISSIPYLLVVLFSKLESPIGISQLISIGISISSSYNVTVKDGLLTSSLSRTEDVSVLFVRDVYASLCRLTTIGDIAQALNNAVDRVTQGRHNLQKILESHSQSRDLLLSLFQLVSGGQSSNAAASGEARRVLEISNSVNVSINVDITSAVQIRSWG